MVRVGTSITKLYDVERGQVYYEVTSGPVGVTYTEPEVRRIGGGDLHKGQKRIHGIDLDHEHLGPKPFDRLLRQTTRSSRRD